MSDITTAELVKVLRCDGIKCDCGGCFYRNENGCILSVQMNDAADRLEQQEQRIAEQAEAIKGAKHIANIAGQRIAGIERELEWKDKVIELAQRKQDEAERELAAAKKDLKLIVDAVRETHCDETCCFACKFDCDTSITDSGCYANECPGFERDDCFEWRGVKEEME